MFALNTHTEYERESMERGDLHSEHHPPSMRSPRPRDLPRLWQVVYPNLICSQPKWLQLRSYKGCGMPLSTLIHLKCRPMIMVNYWERLLIAHVVHWEGDLIGHKSSGSVKGAYLPPARDRLLIRASCI